MPWLAAVVAGDGDVDADDPAHLVEERAAAVAGVDGGVGLQEFDHVEHVQEPALGADDALRDRLPQAERAADCEGPIADLHVLVAVRETWRRSPIFFDGRAGNWRADE